MEDEGTKLAENNKRFIARLRCGLCNRCVAEKTWEEHTQGKEHQFRLRMLDTLIIDNTKKYGHPFLKDATTEVRAKADTKENVKFD